jgi:hypothetical protein
LAHKSREAHRVGSQDSREAPLNSRSVSCHSQIVPFRSEFVQSLVEVTR